MYRLRGRLKSEKEDASYARHRVQLTFQEKVELERLPQETGEGNRESLRVGALQSANVTVDGNFELQLPDQGNTEGPFTFDVLAPDGQVLHRERLQELPQEELEREVDPRIPPLLEEQHPDRFRGKTINDHP